MLDHVSNRLSDRISDHLSDKICFEKSVSDKDASSASKNS